MIHALPCKQCAGRICFSQSLLGGMVLVCSLHVRFVLVPRKGVVSGWSLVKCLEIEKVWGAYY